MATEAMFQMAIKIAAHSLPKKSKIRPAREGATYNRYCQFYGKIVKRDSHR
jgi:hypothetical protein